MGNTGTQHRRPTVVTVAVALWWLVTAVQVGVAAPGLVADVATAGDLVFGSLLAVLFVLAWSALFVWLAARMARGSGRARLALAVFAGLGAVGSIIALASGTASWTVLQSVALVVAVVLSYLPSARPFFPPAERRPRRQEPRTLGWDPVTGERITEPPAPTDRAT